MGAQRRRRHSRAGRGARDLLQSVTRLTRGQKPLTWQNSERVTSIEAVARVKNGDGPDLIIQGSTTLYPQLLAPDLIDRLTLLTYPVVLGSGKRLFGAGTRGGTLRMVDHGVSPEGTIIATYEPAGPVKTGTFATAEPSEAEIAGVERR